MACAMASACLEDEALPRDVPATGEEVPSVFATHSEVAAETILAMTLWP